MPKDQERDDSWDQVSPFFAKFVNEPSHKEHDRRTSRAALFLALFAASLFIASWAAEWIWGEAFWRTMNIVAQIGGALIFLGIGVLAFLAFLQKRRR